MADLKLVTDSNSKEPIVKCPQCGCVSFLDIRHTKRWNGKRVTAGIKASACADCMAAGKVVLI